MATGSAAWRAQMNGEAPSTLAAAERARRSPGLMALALLNRFVDRYFRIESEQSLVSPERAAELLEEYRAKSGAPPSG